VRLICPREYFAAKFFHKGKQYVHMLPQLGSLISIILEVSHTVASRVVIAIGMLYIKLFGSRTMKLQIKLLVLERTV
jgi:hypothetical protein